MSRDRHSEINAKEPLFHWTIKISKATPSDRHMTYGLFWGIPIAVCIYTTWNMWGSIAESLDTWLIICVSAMLIGLAFVAMMLQKTVFTYNIYAHQGEMDHQLYFPDFAGGLFKGLALFVILLFVGAALLTGSLLFLFGPAAIAAGSAMKLMNWERPPVEHEKSRPWSEYNFVTVDRKYRIIVTHYANLTLGFDVRLPDNMLFDQYLAFLRTVLPPSAVFTETVWEW